MHGVRVRGGCVVCGCAWYMCEGRVCGVWALAETLSSNFSSTDLFHQSDEVWFNADLECGKEEESTSDAEEQHGEKWGEGLVLSIT